MFLYHSNLKISLSRKSRKISFNQVLRQPKDKNCWSADVYWGVYIMLLVMQTLLLR